MDLVWWNSRKESTLGKATVDVEFNDKVNLTWWNSQKELTLGKGSRVKVEFTLDLKLLQAAWSADTFVETGLGNFDNSPLSSISHVCHRHVHCHHHRHHHYDQHDHHQSRCHYNHHNHNLKACSRLPSSHHNNENKTLFHSLHGPSNWTVNIPGRKRVVNKT